VPAIDNLKPTNTDPDCTVKNNFLIDKRVHESIQYMSIRDQHISKFIQQKLQEGVLWPEPLPLITVNRSVPSKALRTSDKNPVYPA
jgi:hypothetical protein